MPLLVIAFAGSQQNVLLVLGALVIGMIDLLTHIAYWWVPYVRGATEQQKQGHAKLFGGTTTFLPAIADHPIPNAQHVVVGVLMLSMVVATCGVASHLFISGT